MTNSFVVRDDAEIWLDSLFASARHFHPGCRCVVLTEPATTLRPRWGVEIIRGGVIPNDPLLSRLCAERAFLHNRPPDAPPSPIVFLDFDIIVNAALSAAFDDALLPPWDIGLTYRAGDNSPTLGAARTLIPTPTLDNMPINGGVVLVQAGRYPQAARFFDDLLETYLAWHSAEPWWGEQLSLAAVVGEAGFRQESAVVCRDGFRIGLLPCSPFNHTPMSASDMLRLAPDIKILHFKGKRKTFMADYWRFRRFTGRGSASLYQKVWFSLSALLARTAYLPAQENGADDMSEYCRNGGPQGIRNHVQMMEIPPYFLSRPPLPKDAETLAAFERIFAEAVANGPKEPINYTLSAPRWQFLCWLADNREIVLHGSGEPGIARFEPRKANDVNAFGDREAVYAASDGLWPIYFAMLDRARYPMSLINGCFRIAETPGQRWGQGSDPRYFFSITREALERKPYRRGTVYLLPRDTFERQPAENYHGAAIHIPQWASLEPVAPLAKIAVGPEDFPFLAQLRGHDDKTTFERAAANPGGFPWLEEE